MRIVVCGSRTYTDSRRVQETLSFYLTDLIAHSGEERLIIVEGGARGADALAASWAECQITAGSRVDHEQFPADWTTGMGAGFRRNIEMLQTNPNLVIAFWDGTSRGTAHTIREAKKRGITVQIVPPAKGS